MTTTLHLFLPPLKAGHDVASPTQAGVWSPNPQKILRSIAESIPVGDASDDRGVSSVPDVWARPMMFAAGLQPPLQGKPAHPLRERFVQEWRGLLALLALRQFHADRIVVQGVRLDDGAFSTALETLQPPSVYLEAGVEYAWTNLATISLGGIPVGAFSPASIVFTATSYRERLQRLDYGLKDELGFLRPPTASREKERTQYMLKWLRELKAYLGGGAAGRATVLDQSERSAAKPHVQLINSLIDEWLSDITNDLGADAASTTGAESVSVGSPADSPFASELRLYNAVLRPLTVTADPTGPQSGYELKFNSARARSPHQHVVVISATLLRRNAVVWGLTKLGELGNDADRAIARHFAQDSGTVVPGHDLSKHRAIWIRPERFFFSPVLVKAPQGQRFLHENDGLVSSDRRFVLPLQKTILDYYSVAEIVDQLQPTFTEVDGVVEFSIRLRVGDQWETIRRTYRHAHAADDEGTIQEVAPVTLDVFPRYVDKHWRRYYVVHANAGALTFEPVCGGADVVRHVREDTTGAGAQRIRIVQLTGESSFPEAIEVRSVSEVGGSLPCGLILLAPPREPASVAGELRVGVDFGTSNTNVFMKEDKATARPWTIDFARHFLRVTDSAQPERSSMLRAGFVPPEAVTLPIPTQLRLFSEADRNHPLLDYFVFFSDELTVPENVYTDIKWPAGLRKTHHFLESILFLVLLEAVTRRVETLVLSYSFPKAFSPILRGLYRKDWKDELKRLERDPLRILNARTAAGERDQRLAIVRPVLEVTEGIAAGYYFASKEMIPTEDQRAIIDDVAVCVDVGGGSTDISVWFESQIVFDTSLKFAGGDFAEALRANPAAMDLLITEPDAVRALVQAREHPSRFAACLNLVLRDSDEAVLERMRQFGPFDEKNLWLRRVLAVEFGAIAFYVGSCIGAAERKRPGIIDAFIRSEVAVHWGGNGSKLLNWLEGGRFSQDTPAAQFLNRLLYAALKEQQEQVRYSFFYQRQSPGQKAEAAGGMAVMVDDHWKAAAASLSDADDPDAEAAAVKFVSGEDIELASGTLTHLDEVDEGAMFSPGATKFVRTSLTRLLRFIELVNRFGPSCGLIPEANRVVLNERAQRRIEAQVRARYVSQQAKPAGERLVEPVFIDEARMLLDLVAGGNA